MAILTTDQLAKIRQYVALRVPVTYLKSDLDKAAQEVEDAKTISGSKLTAEQKQTVTAAVASIKPKDPPPLDPAAAQEVQDEIGLVFFEFVSDRLDQATPGLTDDEKKRAVEIWVGKR